MYIDVIDLGLTVKEALDMGLQAEGVVIQKRPSYLLLSRLTPEEKTFLLGERDYYYRGWKGKREGTVKSLLHRGLEKLRKLME